MRVIYQYHSDRDAVVAHRLDYPILFSIATLRACYPEAEVLVLDYSQARLDWQDFPDRLRFQVVRPAHVRADHDGLLGILMARPAQVWEYARGLTCSCDSDVIWLDRIERLDHDYVHINHSNAGLFLFDPAAYRAAAFLGLWAFYCGEAVRHQPLRNAMRAASPETHLHDESVYRYLRGAYPELLDRWLWILPTVEFAHPWDLPLPRAGRVHLVMGHCGARRGALLWLLRESQAILEDCFRPDELRAILGQDYPSGGRFSLGNLDEALGSINA